MARVTLSFPDDTFTFSTTLDVRFDDVNVGAHLGNDSMVSLIGEARSRFLESLGRHPRVRKGKLRVGLVGNRLKPNTNASQQAMEVLRAWPFPLVAQLRDSQAYVVLTGLGKSLFDYHSAQVRDHQADWQPLLKWLQKD